jgi:hypothetical protein
MENSTTYIHSLSLVNLIFQDRRHEMETIEWSTVRSSLFFIFYTFSPSFPAFFFMWFPTVFCANYMPLLALLRLPKSSRNGLIPICLPAQEDFLHLRYIFKFLKTLALKQVFSLVQRTVFKIQN